MNIIELKTSINRNKILNKMTLSKTLINMEKVNKDV